MWNSTPHFVHVHVIGQTLGRQLPLILFESYDCRQVLDDLDLLHFTNLFLVRCPARLWFVCHARVSLVTANQTVTYHWTTIGRAKKICKNT